MHLRNPRVQETPVLTLCLPQQVPTRMFPAEDQTLVFQVSRLAVCPHIAGALLGLQAAKQIFRVPGASAPSASAEDVRTVKASMRLHQQRRLRAARGGQGSHGGERPCPPPPVLSAPVRLGAGGEATHSVPWSDELAGCLISLQDAWERELSQQGLCQRGSG